MIRRCDVVQEAETWLGTPYRHQHTTKHFGCDCLGLIRGIYREILGDEPEKVPPYSPSWGEFGRSELLIEAASRHLILETSGIYKPGQVLIFRMQQGRMAKHCAIMGNKDDMIHAYQSVGSVVKHEFNTFWEKKLVKVFEFPGVVD